MHMPQKVFFALERIPARHRGDAMQQAWVALLEGKDPANAVRNYWGTEKAYERTRKPVFEDQVDDQGIAWTSNPQIWGSRLKTNTKGGLKNTLKNSLRHRGR